MEIKLNENERIDDLQCNGLKIIQDNTGFCFGIDSVILTEFAKAIKKDSEVVDLGTGTGIIGTLLCGKTELKKITGIEIQQEVADMAKKSIKMNKLENKFEIINANIKEIFEKKLLDKNSVDVVITNPPYKECGTGIKNDNIKKLISRHEITATLSDFIEVSSKLLKDKGELYIVHKPERLVDIIEIMRDNKIEPKKIRFVYPNNKKDCNLILIKGVKGGNKFLKIEKPLYIYDENGEYSQEIKLIYK